MNRLLVTLLAAFDAVVAVAVALAAALAPLAVLWVFGLPGAADWSLLWPTAVRVWQLGHLVPVSIALPPDYLTAVGIAADAATFTLSLAPLTFAGFTAIFAARSGARAARAGAWPSAVVAGTVVVAGAAALLTASVRLPIVSVAPALAIVLPALVYGLPALAGAVTAAWREGDDGPVDGVRSALSRHPRWAGVPGAIAAGGAVATTGLIGVGALATAVSLLVHAGRIVGLYEAANVDLPGVIVTSLAQLAYLPTLVVWGAAFVAGPGFAVGTGTAVSPAATNVGVVPGIPLLGGVPQGTSTWLLLLALLVVGLGGLAGRATRVRLRANRHAVEPLVPRVVAVAALAILAAGAAALLATVASGSLGPGRMAVVGPAAGPFALAVGIEVAVGAAIALLAPRLDEHGAALERERSLAGPAGERVAVPATGSPIGAADRDAAVDLAPENADAAVPVGVPVPVARHFDAAAADRVPAVSEPAGAGDDAETIPLDDAVSGVRTHRAETTPTRDEPSAGAAGGATGTASEDDGSRG